MSKSPPPPDKPREDDEYEIVSFEDFCDKSPSSKTDLLTLNDNINYRLHYESDKGGKFPEGGESSSKVFEDDKETCLSDKIGWKKKAATTFAPFGRYNARPRKGPLFVGERANVERLRESPYQNFSRRRPLLERVRDCIPSMGTSLVLLLIIGLFSVGSWWAVSGALGGKWGEEHYRRLWERAHPDEVPHPPHAPPPPQLTDRQIIPENRYHDHNNLSINNKNKSVSDKKKDLDKKSTYQTELDFTTVKPEIREECSKVATKMRFDCFPQDGASEQGCLDRGCCWNLPPQEIPAPKYNKTKVSIPFCYYPESYETYKFLNMTETKHGVVAYYAKKMAAGYPDEFETVQMDVKYIDNDIVQVKLYDAEHTRFEPPYPEIRSSGNLTDKSYRVIVPSTGAGFQIVRNSDNITVIDATVGGLILSDKFLQISWKLPTNKVYGLGERRGTLYVDMNWHTYTIFNFDSPPLDNLNLYGSQPFYLALEDNGQSHGVFLHNANAMDVILQPAPAITYRTIGGILDFYFMLGPSPTQVTRQYQSLVGYPAMPPYWALGFHLCKFNYGSLNETRRVWKSNREAGLPFDAQWNDLDYMSEGNDFTYDSHLFAGLPQFVAELHAAGMKYVVLIDPGVSASEKRGSYPPYDRGLQLNVFIKNSTMQPFVGKVWNKESTVWPDFTHPNASAYWLEMMTTLHKQIPFDGAWIDMNEPSNFISGSMHGECAPENLPYKPKTIGADGLKTKTLCMDAKHYLGEHFNWHNMHGYTEMVATRFAMLELRSSRPLIVSRATWAGSGALAAHWSGDVDSRWDEMRYSIPELLSFSLFGIPLMGSDICGFRGNTTRDLCKRWMQLGAFYPFARNHNSDTSIPQDPASLGADVLSASIKALRLRYSLLPNLYTYFWLAATRGDTVARPLFYEFPNDINTHYVDAQFLIGPGILVNPLLQFGTIFTKIYFPQGTWMSLYTGTYYTGPNVTLLPEDDTVLMRSGTILVQQEVPSTGAVSTHNTRNKPLQLAAMPDREGRAYGQLYWDDGESINSYEEKKFTHIEFEIRDRKLTSICQWWGYGVPPFSQITIYGISTPVKTVSVNNKLCQSSKCQYKYDSEHSYLRIYNVSFPADESILVAWSLEDAVTL